MPFFIDIQDLSERQSNMALGLIYKAIHSHDDDDSIWAPIEGNPFISRIVELFTQRGLTRIEAFRKELQAWMEGHRHEVGERLVRPTGMMERWSEAEMSLVRLYLTHLPPELWTLDDYMMMVDHTVQRYLPAGELRTEAEWLASRAVLMGRVQASMAKLTDRQADKVLQDAPEDAPPPGPTPAQQAAADFARTRAAENVRKLSDDARHVMRGVIAQHVEEKMLGATPPASGGSTLQTKLLDAQGTLNRDWRRIAITEAGEAQTQGYIAALTPGTKVKRVEHYRGACKFCRQIDGKVATVVDPAAPEKDPDNEIWVGKNNVGRSSAPRKRVGDLLVEREPHELWWLPAGLAHPHCRGRWVPTLQDQPGGDPEFAAWLRAKLGKKPS